MNSKGFRTIKRIGNKYQLKVCNKYFDYELKIPKNKFNQITEMFEAWHQHVVDMNNAIKNIWGEMMC